MGLVPVVPAGDGTGTGAVTTVLVEGVPVAWAVVPVVDELDDELLQPASPTADAVRTTSDQVRRRDTNEFLSDGG